MYKVGGSVVIPSEKVIKIIQEIERFDERCGYLHYGW